MKKYIFILVLLLLCSFASAQWNNPLEANNTRGFQYITNLSFVDTFEYYDYNPIWAMQGNLYEVDYEGSTVNDIRQGNTGTISGYTLNHASNHSTNWSSTQGIYGSGAYGFNRVSDYLDIGNTNLICGQNGSTIMAWIKTNGYFTPSNEGAIISRWSTGTGNYTFDMFEHTDGTIRANFNNLARVDGTVKINDSTWHHIAVVQIAGSFSLYVDGVLDGTKVWTGTPSCSSGAHWYIGSQQRYKDRGFNGTIDDVRIYQDVLTLSEIQAEMNSLNPVHTEGLVASYSFEEWGKDTTHAYDTHTTVQGHNEDNTSQAMRFDGVDDRITDGGSTSLQFGANDSFSLCYWTIINDASNTNGMVHRRIGSWGEGYFSMTNSNDIQFGIEDSDNVAVTVNSDPYTTGVWYHVCGIRDVANDKIHIYINGSYIRSSTDTTTKNLYSAGDNLYIGWAGYYMNGTIDDVMIWDRALTQDEITALYNGSARPDKYLYPANLTQTPRWYPTGGGVAGFLPGNSNLVTSRHIMTDADNGYGFDSGQFYINTTGDTTTGLTYWYTNTSYTGYYENFEVIGKWTKVDDHGNDMCLFGVVYDDSVGTHHTLSARWPSTDKLRSYTSNTVYSDSATTYTAGEYVWSKLVKNNSWCSVYVSSDNGNTWNLELNGTCTGNMTHIRFGCTQASGYLDYVLMRELLPKYVPSDQYHASYIYDSANTTYSRGYTVITTYKNGVLNNTYNMTVTDFDQEYPISLTSGIWRFNVEAFNSNGDSANNYTQYLYVDYSGFYPCSAATANAINISYYHEDYPSTLIPATLQIEGTTWDGTNPEKEFNFSFTAATSHRICIEPPDATVNADIYAQYAATGGFTHRYYVINGTFSNTTTYLAAYNFNTTTGKSDLSITVRDKETYQYMQNIIGKLQRRYVGEGVWRTVQMDETGNFGLLFYNVIEESTDYRLVFIDRLNHILDTTTSMKFVCDAGVCEVVYLLEPYEGGASDYNLTIDYDFNNVTGIITVTWQDEDWIPVTVNTVVTKEMLGGYLTLCNVTSIYTANGTHTCNISGQTGTFLLRVRTSRSPFDSAMAEWIEVHFTPILALIGTVEGALISFFIVLVIVMTGVISPVVVVIMTVVALLVTMYLGMLSGITLTFFIVAGVLGLIISLKVKG